MRFVLHAIVFFIAYKFIHYTGFTEELLARGYSKKDIKKILGENFMKLFEANMVGK